MNELGTIVVKRSGGYVPQSVLNCIGSIGKQIKCTREYGENLRSKFDLIASKLPHFGLFCLRRSFTVIGYQHKKVITVVMPF